MTIKKQEMIKDVLRNFDFKEVHRAMTLLNWTWYNKGVPSLKQIKEAGEHHLKNAVKQVLSSDNKEHHEVGWISASGGFKATAWKTKKGKLARIQLEFILTEWDADRDS